MMYNVSKAKVLIAALSCFASFELMAKHPRSGDEYLTLYADYLYMTRTMLHGHGIASDSNKTLCTPCDSFSVLSTKRLLNAFDWESGYRVGLIMAPSKRSSVELIYSTWHEWDGKHTIHGNGTLSFPFDDNDTTDYLFAEEVSARYRSHLYNGEFIYWNHMTPRDLDFFSVSWLLGLRYFYLRENFNLNYTGGSNTSSYDTKSRNYIGGLQLGGNIQMNPVKHWSWDFTLKVGPTLAWEEQRTFLGDVNNTVTLKNFKKDTLKGGLFTDVLASLTYKPFTHLNFRVGYEMIYLTNVALAPEQLEKHNDPFHKRVYTKGEALIHGLFAGMTLGF